MLLGPFLNVPKYILYVVENPHYHDGVDFAELPSL